MKIKEKFENLVASMKVNYKKLPKADQEYLVANKSFTTEYEKFKKEHGLENMYFSRVESVHEISFGITEVCYSIVDLYLEYLNLIDEYPYGADYETYVIKERYMCNTPSEWRFRDSMFAAREKLKRKKSKKDYSAHTSSMFEGVTEIIKLSNPSNGLPGMIIERIPVTREELKTGKLM